MPAEILKAKGANQKARQGLTGGLVVVRLPVYPQAYGGAGAYLELVHHGLYTSRKGNLMIARRNPEFL